MTLVTLRLCAKCKVNRVNDIENREAELCVMCEPQLLSIDKILGWTDARNIWGDPTGLFHLVVARKDETTTHLACGSTVRTGGQIMTEEANRDPHRKCKSCVRSEKARQL